MPSSRYIPLPSKPPTLLKDWQSIREHIADAFLSEIQGVQKFAAESRISRHDAVYTGITGIAFMQYHIAKMGVDLQTIGNISAERLIAEADRNLADVLRRNTIDAEHTYSPDRISFVETSIGIATLVLVRATASTSSSSSSEKVIQDSWLPAKNYLEHTLRKTLDHADHGEDASSDGESEVLYGRAGLLYALLYLRNALLAGDRDGGQGRERLGDLISDAPLSRLVDSIVARGRYGARRQALESGTNEGDASLLPPLMWSWHGKRYLGAAHGVAGILQMLLSCPFPLIREHVPDILNTVRWLADVQDETGNWPAKSPSIGSRRATTHSTDSNNELVQWCHGAPGVMILLSKAIRFIHTHRDELKSKPASGAMTAEDSTTKLSQSLALGAQLVYRKGLLRKGVGLCHGIGGNVYALLAASDVLDSAAAATAGGGGGGGGVSSPSSSPSWRLEDLPVGQKKYVAKAMHLSLFAKFHNRPMVLPGMRTPDHPWSLYEGMAGMCCAWAEVLCRIRNDADDRRTLRSGGSGFPAYDDL